MGKQVFPDTYSVPVRIVAERPSSNSRYRHFTQTHFTAGDEEQFEQHYRKQELRVREHPTPPVLQISLPDIWSKYEVTPEAVRNTFHYLFFKFKKGMLIQIRDGQLLTFLPFSNAFFVNEWHDRVDVPDALRPSRTVLPVQQWYANNGLVRFEAPCNETDTGACHMKNMFETLCKEYGSSLPDVDVFVNRRDFPILKQDGTEPYHHMFDSETQPLVSHAYGCYAPILSACTAEGFADLPIPTMDDWTRVQYKRGVHFASTRRTMATHDQFSTPWNKKRELAVFRGSSTGIGIDPQSNVRLKLVVEFQNHPRCNVGLTDWNTRPRKIAGEPRIQMPRTDWVTLSGPLTLEEQSMYKYIIHVPGHVQAYRLSIELAMRSVILMVQTPYRIWYETSLIPWVHYVPVAADLSDLDAQITWCLEHDAECRAIAERARVFYEQYLTREGCLGYLKGVLDQVARQCVPVRASAPMRRTNRLEQAYIQYADPSPTMYRQELLFKSVNTTIHKVTDAMGQPYVFKQSLRGIRFDHEYFVGHRCLNPLTQKIPNYVYTYALTPARGLYLEYVPGQTFFDYIRCRQFQLNEYYFILLQTFLAIGVAQRACLFTHHDLCPWNIMLMKVPREQTIDYLLAPHHVVRVYTTLIPVILDYDKSHVVHELQCFSHFFGYQSYQDVLCLLVSSLYNVIKHQPLRPEEQRQLMWLFTESLCDPLYCPADQIRTFDDVARFLQHAHRYAHISFAPKGDLNSRTVQTIIRTLMGLHQPMFGQQCETVTHLQHRFLRGLQPQRVLEMNQTVDTLLPPLLALHWRQWFHAFLPEPLDDPEDRPVIRFGTITLPHSIDFKPDSVLLLTPRYLDLWNMIIEMISDGGPYRLCSEERYQLNRFVENDLKIRDEILAYAKHLTKIKLTRNIL